MNAVELARIYNEGFEEGKRQAALAAPVQEQAEQLAKLGWQAIECPFCGSSGAQAFAKPATPVPLTEWQQISEDLRFHGLTLVKTATGYAVLKLGAVNAQASPPAARRQLTDVKSWVGLTDEEKQDVCNVGPVYTPDSVVTRKPLEYRKELEGVALMAVLRAEAKLKEKNTP